MHLKTSLVSAVATVAVTASLAVGPGLHQPTVAAPAAPERTSVTAQCAAAQSALVSAKRSKAKAHRALVKARKALRRAKHTHSSTRIKKAKRTYARAKHRYAVRSRNVRVQNARVGYACSSPRSSAHAAGTGMKVDLLAVATGAAGKVIDPTQLTAVLEQLLPTVTSHLSSGQQNALLNGFNLGTPSLDDATVLLGSVFSTAELQSLLGGSPDPALVLTLTRNIIDELSGLSGVPVPGTLDTTALQGIVGTVTGLLGGLPAGTTGGGGTSGGGGGLCVLGLLCI